MSQFFDSLNTPNSGCGISNSCIYIAQRKFSWISNLHCNWKTWSFKNVFMYLDVIVNLNWPHPTSRFFNRPGHFYHWLFSKVTFRCLTFNYLTAKAFFCFFLNSLDLYLPINTRIEKLKNLTLWNGACSTDVVIFWTISLWKCQKVGISKFI